MKKNKISPGEPSPQASKRVKFSESQGKGSQTFNRNQDYDGGYDHGDMGQKDGGGDDGDLDEYDEELLDAEGLSHGTKKRRTVKDLDDDSDEEGNQAKKKPAKEVKTMKQRDIVGQEKTGAEYEEGQKLEPFNMDEEFEEGNFDETGFYTLKKSAVESHDPWLDSVTDTDIQKAKEAHDRRLAMESAQEDVKPKGKIKLLKEVISVLEAEETPLDALRRLGPVTKKYVQPKKNQSKAPTLSPEQEKERKEKFDKLTDATFQLLDHGVIEINTMPRKELLELLSTEIQARRKGGNQNGDEDDEDLEPGPATAPITFEGETQEPNAIPVSTSMQWRYKWSPDAEVFGPYSSEQMNAWAEQGYFGEGALVCKEGTDEFVSSKRIDFSLYIDD